MIRNDMGKRKSGFISCNCSDNWINIIIRGVVALHDIKMDCFWQNRTQALRGYILPCIKLKNRLCPSSSRMSKKCSHKYDASSACMHACYDLSH